MTLQVRLERDRNKTQNRFFKSKTNKEISNETESDSESYNSN